MRKITFYCDLCESEMDRSYNPDNQQSLKHNGMALIMPVGTWQRMKLLDGSTIDICINCCALITKLSGLRLLNPVKVEPNLGVTTTDYTIEENTIRRILLLPDSPNSGEIINYERIR